ncbi:sigma-70 family RNA polymerase sigma factor [Kitasatospora sp. NPDC085879]|uniref:sigma-70 family RNA polymerase sigma factor n=1 Tax=Kitasatospora sp. NPDC085879 TaxID=3154769 RepID=UPI00343BCBB1
MDSDRAAMLVVQARAGDQYATDELISGHLPLLYNIVGRALGGHSDTDDVVQETLLRAMDGLHGLREPAGFRSWLVAIAMNQIRRRHHERMQHASGAGLGDAYDVADPGADFVDLTIVRLGLSGQRREVAEATRWLDEADRELLALWWLEAAGELTRAELAGAMELPPQHAAVRVQRMKGQLETARVVVRALAVADRCGPLSELTARWDGVPSALWRKRIARHARECAVCSRHWSGLFPAEGLLAGLAMVPVSAGDLGALGAYLSPAPASHVPAPAHDTTVTHTQSLPRSHRRGGSRSGGRGAHRGVSARPRMPLAVGGTVAVTAATAAIIAVAMPGPGTRTTAEPPAAPAQVQAEVSTPQPPSPSASPTPSPSASPTPTPSASPTPTRTPSPKPTPTATRSKSPAPDPSTLSIKQQVVQLVNEERSKVGCTPVKSDDKLELAAQRHSDDMAARNFFDHTNPDGQGPQPRIDAAGYKWSSWGENIARGQRDAAAVMKSWMDSPGHKANILNCGFTDLGVGVHLGDGGPWWTQDFGSAP